MEAELTWPVIATIGTESMWASASGVTRLVAPGPGGRHADADPAGRRGVALGGVAGALLVADEDVAHLDRVEERVVGRAGSRRRGCRRPCRRPSPRARAPGSARRSPRSGVRARACCATCAGLGRARGPRGQPGSPAWSRSLLSPLSGSAAARGRRPCTKKPSSPVAGRRRERVWSEVGQTRRGSTRTRATRALSPGPYAVSTGETAGPTIRNREVAHPEVNPPAAGRRPPSASLATALVDGPPTRRTRMTTEATVVFVVVVGLRFLSRCSSRGSRCPAILACLVLDGIDQIDLPGLRLRPTRLPELRQGDGPVLPVHRVPGVAAELDALRGRRHLAVPLLLPDGRGHGLRDHRRANACCWSSRTPSSTSSSPTSSCGCAGTRAGSAVASGSSRPLPSGSSSSSRRSTGSTWPSSTSPTPGRTSPGSPRSSSAPCSSGLALLWFVVRPRLLPPDWSWRVAADPLPEEMDTAAERDAWTAAHVRVWSWLHRGEGRAHRPAVDDLRPHPPRARGVGPADVRRHLGLRRGQRRHLARLRPAHGHPRGAGRATSACASSSTSALVLLARLLARRHRARHLGHGLLRAAALAARDACTTGSPRSRRCGPSTTAPTPPPAPSARVTVLNAGRRRLTSGRCAAGRAARGPGGRCAGRRRRRRRRAGPAP